MELDHPRVKLDRISTFSAKMTDRERLSRFFFCHQKNIRNVYECLKM